MKIQVAGESFELESSAKSICVGMALLGIGLIFISEYHLDQPIRFGLLNLMLLLFLSAIVGFGLDVFNPLASRWFIVAAASGMVFATIHWLGFPGTMVLLVLPGLLAVMLLGWLPAVLFMAGHVILLLICSLLFPSVYPPEQVWVAIFALICAALILDQIHRQVVDLGKWSVAYWKKGHTALREANQKSEDLEKALQNLTVANQLLVQANHRADRMRAYAENAEKAKALFVARVSHEFRTPLNMIIGLVEIMVEAPETYGLLMPPDLSDDLAVVLRNCQHLSGMIDDVLDLTRVEAGSLTLRRDWVSLQNIFREATEAVTPLIHNKGLRLSIECSEDLPPVYCDQLRVRQVILNLVSNAARFTERGSIEIKADASLNQVLVSVADTGPGISDEDAERIFEPFCQGAGEELWRGKGGSGLGLTISKQFVELHGGQMWLSSQLGLGTTFFFTLPINPMKGTERKVEGWIQPDWVWRESAFVSAGLRGVEKQLKPHVFTLDETGGLKQELEKYADLLNIEELDFDKAEEAALQSQVDLVWVNASLPGRLLELFRQVQEKLPDRPVVGSTFSPQGMWLAQPENIQYLTKPITMGKLEQAIANLAAPPRRVLVVDDDQEVRRLLKRSMMIHDPQLEIRLASNGDEALARLAEETFDLILLDVVMPAMDGWEVIDRLRSMDRARDIPVMILSAQDLADRSPASRLYMVDSESGFTIKRLLECSTVLANLLVENAPTLDAGLQQTPGV